MISRRDLTTGMGLLAAGGTGAGGKAALIARTSRI
jgi:hypothetical protein